MRTRRTKARRLALRSWGASFIAFTALSLLFSLLQPGPAHAQEQSGEVWFTVMFQEGGDFKVSSDGGGDAYLHFNFILYLDPIDIYRNGKAYKEHNVSHEDVRGSTSVENATFEGEYNSKTQTLTGRYESSYKQTDESHEMIETFTGTLEGTLEYRPQQYSGDELVDTIFTMRGKIRCSGRQEFIDLDDIGEDDSYVHDMTINYDFVANGDTGPVVYGGGDTGGGGSKIPGPGSWWEWLTGTVVAGAVAAGTGLFSTLFGGAPAPQPPLVMEPAASLWAPPEPLGPGIAAGTADPFSLEADPHQLRPQNPLIDNVINQTLSNSYEDFTKLPGYFTDKAKWLLNEATDIDNLKKISKGLKEGAEKLDRLPHEMAGEVAEYVGKTAKDPSKPFKDLEEAKEAGAAFIANELIIPILNDPVRTLKAILGADLWENAMDPKRPMPERFAYSALATLNTIGLLEGASGLKNWLTGAGEKAAAAGLVDDAAKGLGRAPKKAIPRVKAKTGFFDQLDEAAKGKAKTIWANEAEKARSKVKTFKKAMKSGDVQERAKAILEIQKDPLAIQELNTQDPRVIKSFNKQLKGLHKDASRYTREKIAAEMGVDLEDVEFFNATNPRAPGVKTKAGMDKDLTPRWRDKDGVIRDYPDRKAQELYDRGFYEAAGSPEGTSPAQLGRDCRNVAVDRHSAEAFGMAPDDWEKMQLGKSTSSTDTVARTMEHKSNEAFTRADGLARSGDMEAAMKERFLGQRETVKSFKNQVQGRARYLGETDPERLVPLNEEMAEVKGIVDEMDRMIQKRATPVQIDDFLRSRNTTAEELAGQIADLYRKLTPQSLP